jgi:HSP20 family molecular chaperone IbpA
MEEIRDHVKGFRHDPAMITEYQINQNIGLKDAYRHLAPMVDTDTYMQWLLAQVLQSGCTVLNERINGDLREQEQALKRKFGVEAIVNCSGLGARELAKDNMYPLRGALIRVKNDGSSMPRITEAHCVPHETGDEQDLVFIVPRGKDMLILGGLTEPGEWSKDISLENYRPIQDMLDRCVEFLPILKQAQFDPQETVRVGLRPMRNENVRLEQEPGTQIIHNYGHGGSGVTFSWGCAEEVAEIVETLLDRVALPIPPHIQTGDSALVQEAGHHTERRPISTRVKLTRYEPFDALAPLRDATNRLFEDSFVRSSPFDLSTEGRTFPVDIYQTDTHYTIEAVLLGVKLEDIQITALGDTLTIHVMQKHEAKKETKTYMRREHYEREVSRTIGLPNVVEPENVEATYEHGILKLQVPKAEVAKPKPISVRIKEAAGTHA